jgi:hypothetical protein
MAILNYFYTFKEFYIFGNSTTCPKKLPNFDNYNTNLAIKTPIARG